MKNLKEKMQYINVKKKIYYGGVALMALMSVSSTAQAMENDYEMSRERCLWNLGTKGYRASALEFMEQKILNGPSQENPKLRIKYIKKLGEFLKENHKHTMDLEILKPGKENEDSPLSKFYKKTLENITTTNTSQEEKDFQILKLEAFYNRIENSKERSAEINTRYNNLKNSLNIEKKLEDKLDIFKIFNIDEEIIIEELKTKYDQNPDERTAFFRSKVGKGYFKLAQKAAMESDLLKQEIESYLSIKSTHQDQELQLEDEVMRNFESNLVKSVTHQVSHFENAFKYNILLANYFLGKIYSNKEHAKVKFYDPNAAYKYYQKIAKTEPLAAYEFAKILEIGVPHPSLQETFLVPANKAQAKDYIELSAKQGHPCAQYDLATDFMEKGFSLLEKSAESGHPKAQLEIAQRYETGNGIEKNPARAFYWYKKAAEQGEIEACYPAGYAYEIGKDYEQATSFYEKSKDPRAQVRLGKMYLKGIGQPKNNDLALYHFSKAASQDNADGNYYLGLMKLKGQGFPKPMLNDAFKNFTSAAQQNHSKALFRLGIINQFAEGTEQNYDAAKNLYENSGIPAAFYYLGNLYKHGLGVEADTEKALELWEKAAASGHKKAAYKAGKACFKTWKLKKDEKTAGKAHQYLQQAAADGDADALYELGHLQKVTFHPIEEKQHYEKAAESGHAIAQFQLGKFYEGIGKPDKAMEYYTDAVEQGYRKARLALRKLHLGKGDPRNFFSLFKSPYTEIRSVDLTDMKIAVKKGYPQAIKWFADEAPQDNPSVQYFLGKLLEKGVHLDKDMPKAIELYQKAAKQGNRSAQRRLADFKQAHLLQAFQLEGSEISIKPFQKAFKESLKKEDQVLEKRPARSNDGGVKVVDNVQKCTQNSTFVEDDKKGKYIEKKENFNILKTANCIDAVEQHIGEGNDKIAKHLDEVLQEHLDQEDDFKLAVSIDSSVGKNSIQQLLEDSVIVEYLNNSSEISSSNQNKSSK